jgi:hypothetical protein
MSLTVAEELGAQSRLEDLRTALVHSQRDLARAKAKSQDLVEAVYRAVSDNLSALTFAPTKKPVLTKVKGTEETAIITFSDLQLGQVTPTYNSDVAEERVHRYADKVLRLTDLQRHEHPIRNAKLYLLGDLIEGELIVPSHPHQVDSSVYAQVALNGPRIMGDLIRRLLGSFEKVDVVSVPGNHGEVGGPARKMYNPETNFDRMLSKIVEHVFVASGEKRATFRVPDGYGRTSWYAVDYVGDVGFHLWHGQQARRTSSSSHLPFYKLVLGWAAGAIPEQFAVTICGHHHVPTMLSIGSRVLFINGTFATDAEYAIEHLASNAKAAQWLLFASPGRGLTAQYLVDVG